MTPDQIDHLRTLLMEACDKHLADGGTIIAGHFVGYDDEKACCPLTCLVGKDYGRIHPAVKKATGMEDILDAEVWSFIYGFDGCPDYPASLSPMAALGHEFRTKYLGKE